MNKRPRVWYIAAGYRLPAGIEAYLLHYATVAREFGYDPRIIVFQALPKKPHRFLQALYDRDIPIESLDAKVRSGARCLTLVTWIPWMCWMWLRRQRIRPHSLFSWWMVLLSAQLLAKRIRIEKPDVIHIKGRLPHPAWRGLPPEKCIYHHALMGTIDPSWLPDEVEAFRNFAEEVRYILVPGENVGRTFRRCFQIQHETNAVFTMAPDEAGYGEETTDRRLQATDPLSQTTDHRPQTADSLDQAVDGRWPMAEVRGRISEDGTQSSAFDQSLQSAVCSLQSAPRGLRFGILCRFTDQKGIVYILEALRLLKPEFGDLKFTFAGQGPLEGEIRRFADENGLAGVQVIPVPSAAEVLRELDVFVHPGLDDAMPVSIVEALMFGLPCVVSDVGGGPDLVRDGVEGFVIPSADAEAIAKAIRRFVEMEAEALEGMRRRARGRYDACCRPEVVMRQVAEVYGDIAGLGNL